MSSKLSSAATWTSQISFFNSIWRFSNGKSLCAKTDSIKMEFLITTLSNRIECRRMSGSCDLSFPKMLLSRISSRPSESTRLGSSQIWPNRMPVNSTTISSDDVVKVFTASAINGSSFSNFLLQSSMVETNWTNSLNANRLMIESSDLICSVMASKTWLSLSL